MRSVECGMWNDFNDIPILDDDIADKLTALIDDISSADQYLHG